MSGIAEALLGDKDHGEIKSYLVGIERGKAWASKTGDYFKVREWSEANIEEFDDLVLPDLEKRIFILMSIETPLEWRAYLKGWLEGVKEIRRQYSF